VQPVQLDEKLAALDEHWRPKIVARLNGQELKIVKIKGSFPWHLHETADDRFTAPKGVDA
jgi:hypothetical protein